MEKFYGKASNDNEINDWDVFYVLSDLDRESSKTGEKFVGIEKTKEQKEIIKDCIKYIQDEYDALGIDDVFDIDINHIHILPSDIYFILMRKDGVGIYNYQNDNIFLNASDVSSIIRFYPIVLHEMIHKAQVRKILLKPDTERNNSFTYSLSGVGYLYFDEKEKVGSDNLRFFNEAVTEMTVNEIGKKNREKIIKKYKITQKQIDTLDDIGPAYPEFISLVNLILDRISEGDENKRNEVWNNIKRGQFTGDLMHLREIEKFFGKGSLRVLALLNRDNLELVREYFQTDYENIKEDIRGSLLG